MAQDEVRTVDGFELIHCWRRMLWQSPVACAADWIRAQGSRPDPWESRWHCRGCDEGAVRAGRDVSTAEGTRMLDAVKGICTRCHRQSDRIISGRFCISCFNRAAELKAGRNAKGGIPSVLARRFHLHDLRVVYRIASASAWQFGRTIEWVSDPVEATLMLLRAAGQPIWLGRGSPVPAGVSQLSFWGGV